MGKKLLFVSEYFHPIVHGGGEINLLEKCKKLVKEGNDVTGGSNHRLIGEPSGKEGEQGGEIIAGRSCRICAIFEFPVKFNAQQGEDNPKDSQNCIDQPDIRIGPVKNQIQANKQEGKGFKNEIPYKDAPYLSGYGNGPAMLKFLHRGDADPRDPCKFIDILPAISQIIHLLSFS